MDTETANVRRKRRIFTSHQEAEKKRREHESYARANWGGSDQYVTFEVIAYGEGWAVCERDEEGNLVCVY